MTIPEFEPRQRYKVSEKTRRKHPLLHEILTDGGSHRTQNKTGVRNSNNSVILSSMRTEVYKQYGTNIYMK